MNGDGMGLSWVWLLLILGVAIRVWWLVRASSTPGGGSSTGQARAREILQGVSRGEITEQEVRNGCVLDDR